MCRDYPRGAMNDAEFHRLYSEVAPALWSWSRLRIHGSLADHVEAEDLVQEVCFLAYGSRDEFVDHGGSFRAWMFGIANNVMKRWLREMARRPRACRPTTSADPALRIPAEATTISRRVARDEVLMNFLEKARDLTEEEQKLLLYRGLEALSHQEVGALLGVGEEVAKKRWQRLRDRLRQMADIGGLLAP